MKNMKNGFTLIEVLVVATIIALLAAAGMVSYSQFSKQSRDAKRKADIEQIRAALEMFRSSSSGSSYPASVNSCDNLSSYLVSGSPSYMSTIPQDPQSKTNTYYYDCHVYAQTYTVAAYLETSSKNCSQTCGPSKNCGYQVGPYGVFCQ